jgi:hypothetical protein
MTNGVKGKHEGSPGRIDILYTTKLVVVAGIYERWLHVQLAFQREGPHATNSSPKQTHDKRKRKENVERWGTTSGGHGAKVATWHGQ